MKTLICIAFLLLAGIAAAQICPDTPAGYTRQPRPAGQPANYPPSGEPACFMITTMTENKSLISCYLCHEAIQRRLA